MSGTEYSNVNFYVPARPGYEHADGNGYVYTTLRVPTQVLRLAAESYNGKPLPRLDNLLITDKPMLNLPITLPVMDKLIMTNSKALEIGRKLFPYHAPEAATLAPAAQAQPATPPQAQTAADQPPAQPAATDGRQSTIRRPTGNGGNGMGFGGFAPARR